MIKPEIIRRVNLVAEREQELEGNEEIVDDIFVLWRAFEAT